MSFRILTALSVSATLVLAACGGSTPPAAQPTSAPAAQSTGASQSAAAPKPAATSKPATSSGGSGSTENVKSVSIPSNAAEYSPAKPPKVGEAVKLPSGVVVQVHGAQTKEKDAQTDWLLTDLTIGNETKESQTISSVLSFDVVTADWRFHGLRLEDIMTLAMASASNSIPATFDADVEPGKAVRGTAVGIVPKDAKGLALVYTSQAAMLGGLAEMAGMGPADPVLYVPLGVRGDWSMPSVPDAAAVVASKTYKAGDALKLSKRGVSLQVNKAWTRTTGSKNVTLEAGQQLVFVDITQQSTEAGKGLGASEFSLVDADDESYSVDRSAASALASDEHVRTLTPDLPRGVLVFEVPTSAKGLKLEISPRASELGGKAIEGEQATIDLGL